MTVCNKSIRHPTKYVNILGSNDCLYLERMFIIYYMLVAVKVPVNSLYVLETARFK